ncbi:hypothetical protein BdWA1_000595 [Babesia duncani]|uniref:Uncharacterized protein n=1 Tax=Babesia duncani TaxID=323732 RepID=A0AAD9PNH8_9APIC|nr:hypothetical protein BdWA1_000595 [Babesia duncani]
MDWKRIGVSFSESQSLETALGIPEDKDLKVRTFRYKRWRYVIGIDPRLQHEVLKQLQDSEHPEPSGGISRVKSLEDTCIGIGSNVKRTSLEHLEGFGRDYQGEDEHVLRYYEDVVIVEDPGIVNLRKRAFSNVFTSDGLSNNVSLWLEYIKKKCIETIVSMHRHGDIVPFCMLPKLSHEQELHVVEQILLVLSKLSQVLKGGELHWLDYNPSTAIAFYFCLVLYFKRLYLKNFDPLIGCCKWLKTWSNDYLRLEGIPILIPTMYHQQVSNESIFWQYIGTHLLHENLSHKVFNKIWNAFFSHLKERSIHSEQVQRSILVLLTEAYIPRLILGNVSQAVHVTRKWLAFNLFNDTIGSSFGHLDHCSILCSQHFGINKDLLDLATAVQVWIKEQPQSDQDLCVLPYDNIDHEPIAFSSKVKVEFINRILDLFGSRPGRHCTCKSRWYNFTIATITPSARNTCFRVLLLLHILISGHESQEYYGSLLMESCGNLQISRHICKVLLTSSYVWARYAILVSESAPLEAIGILQECRRTWAHDVYILKALVRLGLRVDFYSASNEDTIIALLKALEIETVTVSSVLLFLKEKETHNGILTRGGALALALIYNLKQELESGACIQTIQSLALELHPLDVIVLLKAIGPHIGTRVVCLISGLLPAHGTDEDFVEYALGILSTFPNRVCQVLQSWLYRDLYHVPLAFKACEILQEYTLDSNYDSSPVKLGVITMWRGSGALDLNLELPFKIPRVRIARHFERHFCNGNAHCFES